MKQEKWVAPCLCQTYLASQNYTVGDGEFAQVVANHLILDFHLVEGLAIVDAYHVAHHLGQDDNAPQVCL